MMMMMMMVMVMMMTKMTMVNDNDDDDDINFKDNRYAHHCHHRDNQRHSQMMKYIVDGG